MNFVKDGHDDAAARLNKAGKRALASTSAGQPAEARCNASGKPPPLLDRFRNAMERGAIDDFVLSLCHSPADMRRATMSFVVANVAMASGRKTIVTLSNDYVRLSQLGYADNIREKEFTPLKDLMADFVKAGGRIFVCQNCFEFRRLNKHDLVRGAAITSSAELTRFIGYCDCSCYETGPSNLDANGAGYSAERAALLTAIAEQKRAEETQEILLAELDHRVNNILASIQAIALMTLKAKERPAEFVESFNGRLLALGRVHRSLARSKWKGANLCSLVDDQLTLGLQQGADGRVCRRGPDVLVEFHAAINLGLALHELGTNARKHGSLSRPEGRVITTWSLTRRELRLEWVERNGPPAVTPSRRGFGLRFIERSLAATLDGKVQLTFEPAGLRCIIIVPLPKCQRAQHFSPALPCGGI